MKRSTFLHQLLAASAGLACLPLRLRAEAGAGALKIAAVRVIELTDVADAKHRSQYVEVLSDSGLVGLGGPIYPGQGYTIAKDLAPVITGKDAMAGEALWDAMKLSDRHSRAGLYMMAISAVDIALWDLRGKHLGRPVYELLGGPVREKIPVYASMLGYDPAPEAARKTAREFFDRGFTAQKWFLKPGPESGAVGFRNGGITELTKICTMGEVYIVPVIPHGHHIWASLHVVASRPARVAPMCEFLFHWMPEKQYFQDTMITPERGSITLPTKSSLGFAIDEKKVAARREITPA